MRRSSILPMITGCLFALLCATQAYAQTFSGWLSYGGNPQHTAISAVSGQHLKAIRWSTPVDLKPQYSGNDLYIHYGSPLVTKKGNIVENVQQPFHVISCPSHDVCDVQDKFAKYVARTRLTIQAPCGEPDVRCAQLAWNPCALGRLHVRQVSGGDERRFEAPDQSSCDSSARL